MVAVLGGTPNGIGTINWRVRSGLLSPWVEGQIVGGFILAHTVDRDVVVVRYVEAGSRAQTQMQMAFKGPGSGRLAHHLTVIEAAWKARLAKDEADEATERAEIEQQFRPFTDEELAAALSAAGADESSVTLYMEPDPERYGSLCRWRIDMAMRDSPCSPGSATYFMDKLFRQHGKEDPDVDEDDYIVCARCLRAMLDGRL